jgi:hypothetical protein
MNTIKFYLGSLVATPAALTAIRDSGQSPVDFLSRHVSGDYGDVDEEDWKANTDSIRHGARILSVYTTLKGTVIWIITEADRGSTCILLPSEY